MKTDRMKVEEFQRTGKRPVEWSHGKLYRMCEKYPLEYNRENQTEKWIIGPPWYMRKWWMKANYTVLELDKEADKRGWILFNKKLMEVYIPWWAWPLELLHRAVFGYKKIEKIDETRTN